ncbi:MAG: transporter family protein [Halovenus sp.]|jgi:transporter family protein
MSYLWWALLSLVAYALVAPLVSVATNDIPSEVVVVTTNGILVVTAIALLAVSDVSVSGHLTDEPAQYMYAAGILLAIAIVAYYRALELGPVSVVAPIFGTFLVLSSIIGIAFLDEPFTLRKGAGIVLAGVAIWLVSG